MICTMISHIEILEDRVVTSFSSSYIYEIAVPDEDPWKHFRSKAYHRCQACQKFRIAVNDREFGSSSLKLIYFW
jgi:hypothetical protein